MRSGIPVKATDLSYQNTKINGYQRLLCQSYKQFSELELCQKAQNNYFQPHLKK